MTDEESDGKLDRYKKRQINNKLDKCATRYEARKIKIYRYVDRYINRQIKRQTV